MEGLHHGESSWEVKLIDQGVSVGDVRGREYYWQHELDTFKLNRLNEREVALFCSTLFHISLVTLFLDTHFLFYKQPSC